MSPSSGSRNHRLAQQARGIQFIPFGDDPCQSAARAILSACRQELDEQVFDLSNVVVLTPHLIPAQSLRNALLEVATSLGKPTLLGPHLFSLSQWLLQHTANPLPVSQAYTRQFMLLEALNETNLQIAAQNPWGLCEELIKLFDELTLNHVQLPDTQASFTQQLAQSYGIKKLQLRHLQQETELVYQLWQAWYRQHEQEQQLDVQQAYLQCMTESLQQANPITQFYCIGFHQLRTSEWQWLTQFYQQNKVAILFHGSEQMLRKDSPALDEFCRTSTTHPTPEQQPSSPYAKFINLVYQQPGPIMQTRIALAQTDLPTNPLAGRIQVLAASSAEHEALSIDLQIRDWLAAGCNQIGIVTEDRRLARRLRALLERSGIILRDLAGWALSTTSAAAVVERWLECVEEDFDIRALIDLLKSPFAFQDFPRDTYLNSIYRFEHDVVLQQGITRGLQQYEAQISRCAQRQVAWPVDCTATIDAVFQRLRMGAATLQPLTDGREHPLQSFVQALQQSMHDLGLTQPLGLDSAGRCLLEELTTLSEQLGERNLRLNWRTFRQWFGQIIEQANFRPSLEPSPVTLYSLEQSQLLHFDALILGSMDQAHLPGHPSPSIFFNNQVRKELGLGTHEQAQARRFYHFRRLLEAAPNLLITYCKELDGNPNLPSPWLDVLERFHELCYQQTLHASELGDWAQQLCAQVCVVDTEDLPSPQPFPRSSAADQLIPTSITVSDHQSLIDCPYQFFVARCLALQPLEELRLLLKKADFGDRVHQCLEAFHSEVKAHPAPFRLPFTAQNRTAAIAHLTDLSEFVFRRDLQNNIAHRSWLHRWLTIIPSYITWQIQQAKTYQLASTEQKVDKPLSPHLTLRGRLDRIDRSRSGVCVIDYKTGSTLPRKEDVLNGEKVQLSSYALLMDQENVEQVTYLSLNKDQAKIKGSLTAQDLQALTPNLALRLSEIHQAITEGVALPAWGDAATCRFCRFDGICRQQAWQEDQN